MSEIEPGRQESYFDRGAWLTLAFMLVFSLITLVATVSIMLLPGDGWLMPYTSKLDPLPLAYFAGNWPTSLREGDQVIEVAGVNMPKELDFAPHPPPPGWGSGATMRYTVLRNEQAISLDVTLHSLDARGVFRSLWHHLKYSPIEWSWSLIGLLVFFMRPRNPAARLLFIIGLSHNMVTKVGFAATTTSHYFAPLPIFYVYALTAAFWGYLFFPAIILLEISFPRPIFPLTRWPRGVPLVLFGLSFILSLLSIAISLLALNTLVLLMDAVLMLLGFAAALINARKLAHDPVAKSQALWLIFGIAISLVPLPLIYLLGYYGKAPAFIQEGYLTLTVLALPICLAIAITRYHLFDIEVIIRRTLQYTVLTGLLAGAFFGVVVLLQTVFQLIIGDVPEIAFVLSTLGTVALFTPLRRVVQNFIDRRFFRSKYNAEQVLAKFATSARDEVDLDSLAGALLEAVQETMQPQSVTLLFYPKPP